MRIPLFDIDGTLLTRKNPAHRDAFDYALKKIYQKPISVSQMITEGMIDNQILLDALKNHNVPDEVALEKLPIAINAMREYFETHKDSGTYNLLPGVTTILKILQSQHIHIGLLTGNVDDIGWGKMEKAGIKDYFSFGAFGNEAYKRVDLISVAIKRFNNDFNESMNEENFIIVADSLRDIECAHLGNLPIIAVATGAHSYEELKDAEADFVMNTLEDTAYFLKCLE